MDQDWDSIRKTQIENKQELQDKTRSDQYWQELERRCGYGE